MIKKNDLLAVFLINSGKQMSNNYAPYFSIFNLVVIPSYIELPWSKLCFHVLAT